MGESQRTVYRFKNTANCHENPDENNTLYRSDSIVDTMPGISRFQQATLHQGNTSLPHIALGLKTDTPLHLPARIEDYLLKYIGKHSDIEVEHGVMPESLTIDTEKIESDGYPVSVTLRTLPKLGTESQVSHDPQMPAIPNGLHRSNLNSDTTDAVLHEAQAADGTQTEKILAKYVVGCDGAHSWTRRQIGCVMEGDHTDYIW